MSTALSNTVSTHRRLAKGHYSRDRNSVRGEGAIQLAKDLKGIARSATKRGRRVLAGVSHKRSLHKFGAKHLKSVATSFQSAMHVDRAPNSVSKSLELNHKARKRAARRHHRLKAIMRGHQHRSTHRPAKHMSLSDLNDMKTVEVHDALTAKILAKVHHGAEDKSVVPMDDDADTHQFEEDLESDKIRQISNKLLEKVKAKAQKQLKQLSDHPY